MAAATGCVCVCFFACPVGRQAAARHRGSVKDGEAALEKNFGTNYLSLFAIPKTAPEVALGVRACGAFSFFCQKKQKKDSEGNT